MLTRLSIRDVVLIEKLDLSLEDGLTVLTGETGAGKSILLDSLGLALGHRSEVRMIRVGAEQSVVSAAFDVSADHPSLALAADSGIETDGTEIILRRVLRQDGRTRAFINDQPVSVGLLKKVGATLVEIHGQFDTQSLLEPVSHRPLLDAFGGYSSTLTLVSDAYAHWQATRDAVTAAETAAQSARENEDFLRHAVDELTALDPQPGEDAALAENRKLMQHAEQISDAMAVASDVLGGDQGAESQISAALSALERVSENAAGRLDDVIGALQRSLTEAADARGYLDKAASDLDIDPKALEDAEDRLFTLRAAARKYNVDVDALTSLKAQLAQDLRDLDAGGEALEALRRAEGEAREKYIAKADILRTKRLECASVLDRGMHEELKPLKLGAAVFKTTVEKLTEDKWSAHGLDRVAFEVATNPGAAPGPLAKIASGGELARFMLALKVILAEADPVPVLVFDEVDAGIGGAVAAAVGDRLAQLGALAQVLVVTHSPQVAARGGSHMTVLKAGAAGTIRTDVQLLDAGDRREEIARMLSGAEITGEARAAAESLLNGAAA